MLSAIKHRIRDRLARRLGVPEIQPALEQMRDNGFQPSRIFDVGAYRGNFARICRALWPQSHITCFEVLPQRVDDLRVLCAADGNIDVVEVLMGNEVRDNVPLHEMETASSILDEHYNQAALVRHYPMKTVDQVVAQSQAPDFLKLDVQGYEFEVLQGAGQTLPKISAILTEVNLIDIHKDVHLLDELIMLLRSQGFVAYDICGLARRPFDKALWQADFIFVPLDSQLRADKRWAAPI